jgi:hypothetical protein
MLCILVPSAALRRPLRPTLGLAMNAQERLHAAHLGTLQGKYAEALSEYVWFHHHALAERRSLYGVRLSFALAHWKDLAEVYPPALAALHEVLDDKRRRLLSGEHDRELFHDVEALNRCLGASVETSKLFGVLDREAPKFAQECSDFALGALVEAEEFTLAAKYLPDPVGRISRLAERLTQDIERIPERPRSKSRRYRAYTWNFTLDLRTVTAILSGAGRQDEADNCRVRTFALLKPWYLRKAVEKALASKA